MKASDPEGLSLLISELERDYHSLGRLIGENHRAAGRLASGAEDSLDYAALGYTLHNIYCLLENYFLRVAKAFENHIDGDQWHKDLVGRMTLEVEGIRPALLDEDTALALDELRAFRHVFRNVYQTTLKPEKVLRLQASLPVTLAQFGACHTQFLGKLRQYLS